MTSPMRIEKDFKEFLRSLASRKARFLIIGGFAYSIYAQPRYTEDLDIFIEQSEDNAERVLDAIIDFLGESLGLKIENLLTPRTFIQLGYPPLRIDVTTHCEGLVFTEAWEKRIAGRYDDVEVFFLSLDDLIKNKIATGRDQDLIDAKKLSQVKEAQRPYGR
jgi:predicted nucleotidyltransferase